VSGLVALLDGKTGAELRQRPRCLLKGQVRRGRGGGGGLCSIQPVHSHCAPVRCSQPCHPPFPSGAAAARPRSSRSRPRGRSWWRSSLSCAALAASRCVTAAAPLPSASSRACSRRSSAAPRMCSWPPRSARGSAPRGRRVESVGAARCVRTLGEGDGKVEGPACAAGPLTALRGPQSAAGRPRRGRRRTAGRRAGWPAPDPGRGSPSRALGASENHPASPSLLRCAIRGDPPSGHPARNCPTAPGARIGAARAPLRRHTQAAPYATAPHPRARPLLPSDSRVAKAVESVRPTGGRAPASPCLRPHTNPRDPGLLRWRRACCANATWSSASSSARLTPCRGSETAR
jgi:hypothetical protein